MLPQFVGSGDVVPVLHWNRRVVWRFLDPLPVLIHLLHRINVVCIYVVEMTVKVYRSRNCKSSTSVQVMLCENKVAHQLLLNYGL